MSIEVKGLPIVVTEELRTNKHVMNGLAQKAFRLANYDMAPDDPVTEALDRGLIVVEEPVSRGVAPPMPIRRMPGNGSFA